jgi:hypothetical protein
MHERPKDAPMSDAKTPRELFALAQQSDEITWARYSICEANLPELDTVIWDIDFDRAERMKVRPIADHYFDGRRGWDLHAVWLDDRPVMLTQCAGRHTKDHTERFIVDADAFGALVGYLLTLVKSSEAAVDMDTPNPALTEFYGYSLDQILATPSGEYPR